jgi:hypothetical protein
MQHRINNLEEARTYTVRRLCSTTVLVCKHRQDATWGGGVWQVAFCLCFFRRSSVHQREIVTFADGQSLRFHMLRDPELSCAKHSDQDGVAKFMEMGG